MKISYYISLVASALSVVLAIVLLWIGNVNQGLQGDVQKQQQELQAQQEVINKGNAISQQVGPNILRDMAVSSLKNEKMRALLDKYGYKVQAQASPAPGTSSSGSSSAPAAPTASEPSGAPALR